MIDRPKHLGLRHMALFTNAFDEMKRFYVDWLGFEVEWEPDGDNIYLTSGSDNLALHRGDTGHDASGGPRSHRDGARSLYLCDPDGNTIQILYHPPISDL